MENVLLEHDAEIEATVVASRDPLRGAVPKAFIVLKDGIAPYKYPREVEFVTALPRTEIGKIRRVVLREREAQRKPSRSPGAAQ